MALLKCIEDRGAVVTWSPCKARPALMCLGTKGGAMTFEDNGGDLELYDMNFQSDSKTPTLLCKGPRPGPIPVVRPPPLPSTPPTTPTHLRACRRAAGGWVGGASCLAPKQSQS